MGRGLFAGKPPDSDSCCSFAAFLICAMAAAGVFFGCITRAKGDDANARARSAAEAQAAWSWTQAQATARARPDGRERVMGDSPRLSGALASPPVITYQPPVYYLTPGFTRYASGNGGGAVCSPRG